MKQSSALSLNFARIQKRPMMGSSGSEKAD